MLYLLLSLQDFIIVQGRGLLEILNWYRFPIPYSSLRWLILSKVRLARTIGLFINIIQMDHLFVFVSRRPAFVQSLLWGVHFVILHLVQWSPVVCTMLFEHRNGVHRGIAAKFFRVFVVLLDCIGKHVLAVRLGVFESVS